MISLYNVTSYALDREKMARRAAARLAQIDRLDLHDSSEVDTSPKGSTSADSGLPTNEKYSSNASTASSASGARLTDDGSHAMDSSGEEAVSDLESNADSQYWPDEDEHWTLEGEYIGGVRLTHECDSTFRFPP